jgi:hypothetical protein
MTKLDEKYAILSRMRELMTRKFNLDKGIGDPENMPVVDQYDLDNLERTVLNSHLPQLKRDLKQWEQWDKRVSEFLGEIE